MVGYLDEDLPQEDDDSLGYFITDAMLAHQSSCGEATIAWYNQEGLRDRLYAGAVTYRDLFNIAPFRDELVYFTMSGEQIRELIKEEEKILMAGRILSNEAQNWHASYPNEVSLSAEQEYRLVTIQFIKQQLEQQQKLPPNLSICQDGILDEVLANHFRAQEKAGEPQEPISSISAGTIDGFGINSPHIRVGVQGLSEALDAQQKMGIRWTREDVPWEFIESEKGEWRWRGEFGAITYNFDYLLEELEQRDIEMVALLDYGPRYLPGDPNNNYHVDSEELMALWRGYVREVVKQFGDRIDYWEIGSQMNSRLFWGKVVIERDDVQNPDGLADPEPELYAQMLQIAHEEIKAHNQNDIVILGGLAGFHSDLADCATNYFNYLDQLHQAGAWAAFDVIAIHPYHNSPGDGGEPPERLIDRGLAYDPTSGQCLTERVQHNLISEVRAVRELTEVHGSKPIWITEIGWGQNWSTSLASAYRDGRVTAAELQADYLVRTYVPLLAEPSVEKVFWYTQVDDPNVAGWELQAEGQQALGNISTLLTGSTPLGQVQGQNDRGGADDDDVYEYRFSKDNQLIIVIWKARGGDEKRDVTITKLDVETIRLYNINATELSPEAGNELTVQEGKVTIQLTERPVFLIAEVPNWWEWSIEWPEWVGWPDFSEWQKRVEEWWQGQQEEWAKRFEAWQKEIERQIEEQIKKQIEELVKGICGAGMLPFGILLLGGVLLRRRKRSD